MSASELSEHARQVLQALLFEYTVTAEPVGVRGRSPRSTRSASPRRRSATRWPISRRRAVWSPPHTSAGRVPTDKAYRYYVDSLMGRTEIARPDAYRLQRQVSGRSDEIDDLMEATSAQLSELSHYAAVILAPPLQHTRGSSGWT